MIRRLVGLLITDLVEATAQRIKESGARSVLDLQQLDHNVIGYTEDMHRRNRELKDFLFNNLYRHHRVVRMQTKAEKVISDIFNAYVSEPEMLPGHIQHNIAEIGLERTVCDYIAGMTDRFAIQEHEKLFNPLIKT
jgi:dGTPase